MDRIHRVDRLEMGIPIRIQLQTVTQHCRTHHMDRRTTRAHRVNTKRLNQRSDLHWLPI